jgi:hypothetical protein
VDDKWYRRELVRDKVDVIVAQRRACQEHSMRMESRADYRRRPVVVEEISMRLVRRESGPIHIERLDFVAIGAAGI